MSRYKKMVVSWLLAAALALSPLATLAADMEATEEQLISGPEGMAVDAVLVRPIGLVATVTGVALYVISLPFSAAGGNAPEAWSKLVVAPARFTFDRPLGHFHPSEEK